MRLVIMSGCFWGSERVLSTIPGVSTRTGYAGGKPDVVPTYYNLDVSGYAEAVEVTFDPDEVTLAEVLAVALGKSVHDPSPASSPRYRRGVICGDEVQAAAVRRLLANRDPCMFDVTIGGLFHPAEPYHQKYYDRVLGA